MNTDELVKQKVDADIARYKSRKPNMTQEQENMLRKEFTRIQIDLIADRKKSEKSKPSLNKIANMLNNKQKTDEKQQKTDEKQQKSNEILSKNSTQYSRAGENDKKDRKEILFHKQMENNELGTQKRTSRMLVMWQKKIRRSSSYISVYAPV